MSDKSWFFEKIGALAKVIKGVTFWGICIGSWRGRSAAGSADSEGYLELPVFIAGDIDGSVPSARSISVVGALNVGEDLHRYMDVEMRSVSHPSRRGALTFGSVELGAGGCPRREN